MQTFRFIVGAVVFLALLYLSLQDMMQHRRPAGKHLRIEPGHRHQHHDAEIEEDAPKGCSMHVVVEDADHGVSAT